MARPTEAPPAAVISPAGWQRAGIAAGLSLSAAVCLSCVLALTVAQMWLQRAGQPFGSAMELCAGRGAGNVQLSFSSPFISSFGPPPNGVCLYLPWAPFLPQETHVFRWPI